MNDVSQFVSQLHHAGTQFVLAVTGGGSEAISALFTVPGASRSMLLATVPYSEGALVDWLGSRPEQFCSARTARAMAMAGYQRAPTSACGLACTASLASDRPKKGDHRFFLAAQTLAATHTFEVTLAKNQRTRAAEETLVATAILNLAAQVAGLAGRLPIDWLPGETPHEHVEIAPPEWQSLLLGQSTAVCAIGSNAKPQAVFPGAFNPRHAGHRQMAALAEQIIGAPVAHEISITNVDKPPLDYVELATRLRQFDESTGETVWLTRLPTFAEKAAAFPGATFVVGADTIERIAEPRYYGGNVPAMLRKIEDIATLGCRFLVFGRNINGKFETVTDLNLPPSLATLCSAVPEELFREDISSTALRKQSEAS
jgi:nicotinamide mononucleotide (NMN) deamidase PncC/nicotinic acid mononucleotide adenylyltransferase